MAIEKPSPASSRRSNVPIYPPLVACFPLLSLYSANAGLVPLRQVWAPMLVAIAASSVIWAVASILIRDVHRGAFLASVLAILFLGFGKAQSAINGLVAQWVVWGIVGLGAIWLAIRFGNAVRSLTAILNFASLAAVTIAGGAAFVSVVSDMGAPGQGGESGGAIGADNYLPDVFYIVLDCYGRPDQLKRVMGFDDAAFVDDLRKRGFYIAANSHPNYVQTEMSLASTLNMDYLDRLMKMPGPDGKDRKSLDRMVERSRVADAFRRRGYRYIAVTSGFPSFDFSSADAWYHSDEKYSFFAEAVVNETPLAGGATVRQSMFEQHRRQLAGAFAALGRLAARRSQPKFVLAHILAPHPPFVFGPNGEPVQPKTTPFKISDGSHFMKNGGTPEEYRRGYSGQAQWLNRQVVAFLDELAKQRGPQPIVLIQGDHGSKSRMDMDSLARSDLGECMCNLSAYLVPDRVRRDLYPSITPVNSFRILLREEFGVKLPLLPDRSYFSPWSYPYRLEEVTPGLVRYDTGRPLRSG